MKFTLAIWYVGQRITIDSLSPSTMWVAAVSLQAPSQEVLHSSMAGSSIYDLHYTLSQLGKINEWMPAHLKKDSKPAS